MGSDAASASEPWVNRGVVGVGAASLFSDSSHELVTSLLPSFLTSSLHAGPGALGAIDGISDALVGLAKLAGGPLAADPQRRSRIASGGYLGTATATAAIGLTVAVWQVAVLRALAWVSRGIRSPARDAMLISLVPRNSYGRASGLERAGDNAGAVIGPLLASFPVALVGVRPAILLAIVPGMLAAAAITVSARAARGTLRLESARHVLRLNLAGLRAAGLPRTLLPAALFEFGNLTASLLILRCTDLLHDAGRPTTAAAGLAILL